MLANREPELRQELEEQQDDARKQRAQLEAQITQLQEQAKPQPKPKPQPGIATLRKRIATLEDENRALAKQVTKIASLKRARKMQHDRRVDLRNMDNDQKSAELPAAKKRNTRNSRSSTTVDNN